MKSATYDTGLAVLTFFLLIPWLQAKPETPSHARSLQNFSLHLSRILPAILDEAQFYQLDKEKDLLTAIKAVHSQSHPLSFDRPSLATNQVLRYISPDIDQDLLLSSQLFETGDKKLARALLKKNLNLCFDCHSKQEAKQNLLFSHQPADFAAWGNLLKGRYYAETWNFPEAIRYFEYGLSDLKLSQQAENRLISLKSLMAMVIHFKRSPELAMEMVRFFTDQNSMPASTRTLLSQWDESAKSWLAEKTFARTRPDQLKKIKELYQIGREKNLKQEHAGTIEILRAQFLAQNLLNDPVFDKIYGEALALAGAIAELAEDTNFWTPHSIYYEACVRFQPHTDIAKSCFQKVDEEYLKLTQLSLAQALPKVLSWRLKKLVSLAQPK